MADVEQITDTTRQSVDGHALTESLGLDEEEIQWRKSFTGFSAADASRLEDMAPLFESMADPLTEEFYDTIEAFDETRSIIERSSRSIEALQGTMHEYVLDLGRGTYDREYFDRRARVGKIHDMLDLGPKIYLGAYRIHYESIIEGVVDDARGRLDETSDGEADGVGTTTVDDELDLIADRLTSAMKLLLLDQQVAMETYIQSYSELESVLEEQRSVAQEVTRSVTEATGQSEAVAERADSIRETTNEQTEDMREVADELTTLSATTQEVASTAAAVRETSEQAKALTDVGRESAADAVEAIEAAGDASTAVGEDVDRLNETVDDIDTVLEIIEDIADRTNLLALNASIEAARAGEAGSGFAVVVEEVKSLAEQSKERANEIESLVRDIEGSTAQTTESLETAQHRLSSGVEDVEATLEQLESIATAVEETTEGMEELASATDDQAHSSEAIAHAVDRLSEQINTVHESIAEVAEANESQADRLADISDVVRRFETGPAG